ncbi:MAG: putative methyltransferase [Ilumatobacteraceae bacterium]|nr:putative methyltransferase [Ilumatobacteraceae bacterium]
MDAVELLTSHLVVGGAALARQADGRVVFVSGALPGETVSAEVHSAKKDFAKADVRSVVHASPDRVEPACEAWHRGCGGCDWQHIDPAAQLRHKTAIVREALTRTARLVDPVVVAAGSVSPWAYRTTVRLATSGASIGFRSRRSHDVVAIDACPVSAAVVNAEIAREATARRSGRLPDSGDEVVIRTSIATGEVNSSNGKGPKALHEDVAGHRLRVSLGSFFQSSPQAADLLVAAVAAACGDVDLPTAHVVDAYGGIGLFGATVAASAREVTLIEGSAAACADARVNLAGRTARIVEARVEDWKAVPADLVIADPARHGLDRQAAAVLVATGAPVIVLVSCDTGSLARDARILAGHGYRHDGTQVIDAFPNTAHIETVSRFVLDPRGVGDAVRRVT